MKNNDMRSLIAIMRNNNGEIKSNINIVEEKRNKSMSMRDMMKIMRNLNEDVQQNINNINQGPNKATPIDQDEEENKMRSYFQDDQVDITFKPLEIFDNAVFWAGIIDGTIGWVFKVTQDDNTSGFTPKILNDYNKNNSDNDKILNKLELYYNDFYKYWRDNVIQK